MKMLWKLTLALIMLPIAILLASGFWMLLVFLLRTFTDYDVRFDL